MRKLVIGLIGVALLATAALAAHSAALDEGTHTFSCADDAGFSAVVGENSVTVTCAAPVPVEMCWEDFEKELLKDGSSSRSDEFANTKDWRGFDADEGSDDRLAFESRIAYTVERAKAGLTLQPVCGATPSWAIKYEVGPPRVECAVDRTHPVVSTWRRGWSLDVCNSAF